MAKRKTKADASAEKVTVLKQALGLEKPVQPVKRWPRPPENPIIPKIYFESQKEAYWLSYDNREYEKLSERNVKRRLMLAGVDNYERPDGLKTTDFQLVKSQMENGVDWAGPVSGMNAGLIKTTGGENILVTNNSTIVPSKIGSCEHWEKFLTELLPDLPKDGSFGPPTGYPQWHRFVCWLKFARKSFKAKDYAPGQVLVLAGPAGCGKSFLQLLITETLGGRQALPYRYMMEKSTFNEDLAGAAHWVIEDQNALTDIRSRRLFGSKLKEATVNKYVSIHGKGKTAIALPVFRRISISVNDEAENLMIIPPLDASIVDKIILLKCSKAECLTGDYLKDWKAMMDELPAFCAFVDSYRMPKAWADKRFGVSAWHHPELLNVLDEMSPEVKLLDLIDSEIAFGKERVKWEGTAEEVNKAIRTSENSFTVDRLLYFPSSCGVYLARLSKKYPQRFESFKRTGKTFWRIQPPAKEVGI